MPTFTSPPILVWMPGGGVPGGPISNPPVYSQSDVTQLVIGQAYIDVVFGSIQTDDSWVLVACEVYNNTDLAPLNIWPGIITNRTTAGFRLWLNGMPDSGNYYLSWAVSGINILPVPASLYLFTGPTSGVFGVNKTFTVKLPPSTTLSVPITVTPDDGGLGGTFSPPTVTLSSGSATATFTYNAVAYGAATLSVTNSGTLLDPAPIVFTSTPPIYTFSGPTGGNVAVASTNYTVQLLGDAAIPTTVTPHDGGGGGTFTPTTVLLVVGVPVHFTYTPVSVGTKTISVTNDGGLANPANLSYVAVSPYVFDDTFTGTSTLAAHVADTGHTWATLFTGAVPANGMSVGLGVAYYSIAASPPEYVSSFAAALPDQEATATISKGIITGAPEIGIWLRATANTVNPTGYLGRFVEGSGYQFYRLDPGTSYVQLGSNVAGSVADGDLLRFTVSGTGATVTLTLYKNGASVASTTDTSGSRILITGKVGIHLYDPIAGAGNYRMSEINSPA